MGKAKAGAPKGSSKPGLVSRAFSKAQSQSQSHPQSHQKAQPHPDPGPELRPEAQSRSPTGPAASPIQDRIAFALGRKVYISTDYSPHVLSQPQPGSQQQSDSVDAYPTPDSAFINPQSAGSYVQPVEVHSQQKLDQDNITGSGASNPSADYIFIAPDSTGKQARTGSRLSRHLHHNGLHTNPNIHSLDDQENSPPGSAANSRPASSLKNPLSKPKQVLHSLFGGLSNRSASSEQPSPKFSPWGKSEKSLRHKQATPNSLNERYRASISSSSVYLPGSVDQPGTDAGSISQTRFTDLSERPSVDIQFQHQTHYQHQYQYQQREHQQQYQQQPSPVVYQSPRELDPQSELHQHQWSSPIDGTASQRSSVYSQPSQIQGLPVGESQNQVEYPIPQEPAQDPDNHFHPAYPNPSLASLGEIRTQQVFYQPNSAHQPQVVSPRQISLQSNQQQASNPAPAPAQENFHYNAQQVHQPHPSYQDSAGHQLQHSAGGQFQENLQSSQALSPQSGASPQHLHSARSTNFSLPLSFNSSRGYCQEDISNAVDSSHPEHHQEHHSLSEMPSQHQGGNQPQPPQQTSQSHHQAPSSQYGSQGPVGGNDGQYGYHQPNGPSVSQQGIQYEHSDQQHQQHQHQPAPRERSQSRQDNSSSHTEADYENLRSRFNKLAMKHNQLKKTHGESQQKLIMLENALASQNMTFNRMSLDDEKYIDRFSQMNKNISQLSHLIRKSWKNVPGFLLPYINHDAVAQGGREMIAVGRSFFSTFLCYELFDKFYHSGLSTTTSEHLRQIQSSLIDKINNATSAEDAQLLRNQLLHWRTATFDGLADKFKGGHAETYRNSAIKTMVDRAVKGMKSKLQPTAAFDVELEKSLTVIVSQAFDLLDHMAYESRVITVEIVRSETPFDPATMEVCSSMIPPLGVSMAEGGPQSGFGAENSGAGANAGPNANVSNNNNNSGGNNNSNNNAGGSPSSSPIPTSPPVAGGDGQPEGEKVVRFAVDWCVRILDRNVLQKTAVYLR